MKRLLLLCAGVCLASPPAAPIRIEVLAGKEMLVTVPEVAREDIERLMASFFSRGDPKLERRFREALKQCPNLTLTITTR